jgi:hypothetical protein
MKIMRAITLFIILFLLSSCQETKLEYSFFVAGHVYGHPLDFKEGLHPTFKHQFSFLREYPKMQFGILTGDVVPRPQKDYWDAFRKDVKELGLPIHIAAGNHDRGDIYYSRYSSYYSFRQGKDLFLILHTKDWTIEGKQKEFLATTLEQNANKVDHIFIFCHELIWWSPENQFKNIEINYRGHYPGSSNYWEEIHPILKAQNKPIYLFAGDLGATEKVSPYMYHKEDQIHFIASGMGSGKYDNFILVEKYSNGELLLKLMGFDEENVFPLEDLRAFQLP